MALTGHGDIVPTILRCEYLVEPFLYCKPPRSECAQHGVKTMSIPWAGKHSRFTQWFEAFAIKVER
jgi:hypothetical protein